MNKHAKKLRIYLLYMIMLKLFLKAPSFEIPIDIGLTLLSAGISVLVLFNFKGPRVEKFIFYLLKCHYNLYCLCICKLLLTFSTRTRHSSHSISLFDPTVYVFTTQNNGCCADVQLFGCIGSKKFNSCSFDNFVLSDIEQ